MNSPEDVLVGAFGPFTIERELGSGGMATVYLARHPKLGPVALKVLHRHLVKKPEVLHRFWREMRLSDKLDHPHIVRTRDAGVEGDRFYVAMDFVDGSSLYDYERKKGRLDPAEAMRLMGQILDGLEHAHQAGMIHRDLKPENILIDNSGNARISDFGIAKHMEASVMLTRTGTAMGTPYYMAPEQIRNAKAVGPPADVYSAGIMLYEMLTGSVPFHAKDPMDVVHHHIHAAPLTPVDLVSSLPAELDLVVLKAMEKAPEDRFKSAATMAKALAMVARGERTGIKIKGPIRHRDQGSFWSGAAVVVVVIVLGILAVRPDVVAAMRAQMGWGATVRVVVPGPPGPVAPEGPGSVPVPGPGAAGPPPTSPPGPAVPGGSSGPIPGIAAPVGSGGAPPGGGVPMPVPAAVVSVPTLPPEPAPQPRELPELIEKGRWERAGQAARIGGSETTLRHLDAWTDRIRTLLKAGDAVQADRAAGELLASLPNHAGVGFLAGEAALAAGHQEVAATRIAEGFRLAGKTEVDGLFDKYRPVLKTLGIPAREAMKLRLREIAELRVRSNSIDEAIVLLRQSSRIHETVDTHRRLAELYKAFREPDKAKWHEKRAEQMAAGAK